MPGWQETRRYKEGAEFFVPVGLVLVVFLVGGIGWMFLGSPRNAAWECAVYPRRVLGVLGLPGCNPFAHSKNL